MPTKVRHNQYHRSASSKRNSKPNSMSQTSEASPLPAKAKPESSSDDTSPKLDQVVPLHFNMREVKIGKLKFNPVVSGMGGIILWGLALYCMIDDNASTTFGDSKDWVTEAWSWLYIGSQNAWVVFLIYVYVVFGDRKLGADDEKPAFDNISYFAMIFSAGIGTGLFFFGISEPMWHYVGPNRFTADPGESQNERSMDALNLSLFHWGLHAWVVYSFIACHMAFMSYRKGFPLTIRSCFYPLLGEHTWGYIGDLIDGTTVITIIAGICTSLGLGASQILRGMITIGLVDESVGEDENQLKVAQVLVIWGITLFATASVVSGLDRGIKLLSQIALGLAIFLLVSVIFLDKTWFLLNVIVQLTGYHFQWILQMGFWTDAFAQISPYEGSSVDPTESAPEGWFGAWTMFYWGWWIAWSPFVGAFLARISRGRTIKQVFNYTMTIPLSFMIVWFGVFGAAGIRMYRRAEELMQLGADVFGDTAFFETDKPGCYGVPEDLEVNVTGFNWDESVSPVCTIIGDNSWFDVMYQYGELGRFLSTVSLLGMVFYFVTSADSGALIVDTMASNGAEDHHVIQRIFWAFTLGALATALLVGAGSDGLTALQSASLIVGLPYTFFISMMTVCFYRALKYDVITDTERSWKIFSQNQFSMPVYGGILDYIEILFGNGIKEGRGAVYPAPGTKSLFLTSLVVPFMGIFKVLSKENGNKNGPNVRFATIGTFMGKESLFNVGFSLLSCGLFYMAVGMMFLGAIDAVDTTFINLGLVIFTVFSALVSYVRFMVRNKFDIRGNVLEDFFASWILYPQVIAQLSLQADTVYEEVETDDI